MTVLTGLHFQDGRRRSAILPRGCDRCRAAADGENGEMSLALDTHPGGAVSLKHFHPHPHVASGWRGEPQWGRQHGMSSLAAIESVELVLTERPGPALSWQHCWKCARATSGGRDSSRYRLPTSGRRSVPPRQSDHRGTSPHDGGALRLVSRPRWSGLRFSATSRSCRSCIRELSRGPRYPWPIHQLSICICSRCGSPSPTRPLSSW